MVNFVGVERCRQDVIAAQIQHLGPQARIGEAGRDDHARRSWQHFDLVKQQSPTSTRQILLANYYRHRPGHNLYYLYPA